MRLHSLTLQAFGPFACEQRIDFDLLAAGGLFLLDGPTGAGKTTVLDAITFALYGPGDRGGDGRLHSDFAAAGVEPRVQLEFSLRGVRYRVSRTPEYERPKLRGEGTTRQAAAVHLERLEEGGWVSRSSNKAEVAEMLADEVGLTRDQFTQVVLLPQGEFARFLRADDDDRRTLLTKLFGTHLYDRITDELDRRRAAAVKDIDEGRGEVQTRLAAVAEAAGLDGELRSELLEAASERRSVLLDGLAAELEDRLTAAGALAQRTAAARRDARECAAAAVAEADRVQRFAAAVRARAAHEAGRGEHERRVEELTAARRAEPVRALLDGVADADAAVAEATALIRADGAAGVDPQWLAGEGADELAQRAVDAACAAAELQHLVDREAGAGLLGDELELAAARADAAGDEVGRLAARAEVLPSEIAATSTALDAARAVAVGLDGALERADGLRRRAAAAERAAALATQVATARAALADVTDRHQRSVDEHQRLTEARLAGIAAELAAGLSDGQPCAVCGSVEHPDPTRPAADAVRAEQVRSAAVAREAAEHERERATRALAELERALAAEEALVAGGSADEITAELAAVEAVITSAREAAERIGELVAVKEALEAELAAVGTARADAAARLSRADAELAALRKAQRELAAELLQARAGYSSVTGRQSALREHAERYETQAATVQRLAAALQARASAAERARREAGRRGFDDLDTARAAVLSEQHLAALAAEVEAWQAEAERVRAATDAAEFSGLVADNAGERSRAAVAAAEDAAELERTAETQALAAADAAQLARHASERFSACRAELAAAEAGLAAREAQSAPVVYLAKLAKGMTGQRRVALTTYVLRYWFEQVVQSANIRLAGMSSGRYELVRVDEGSTRNERSGLTLAVLDRHTGEQRSARSLSGGETFYTSLALALGLADVVTAQAGGVDLDTLFIDEGFGSLDPDTLDEVMTVIDELRDRGRVVGIVSHVTDLKDRIAERLEVRRLPDGSSTLRVVA